MSSVERSTTIDASPDDVWAILADFGEIGLWAPNCDHSCLLSEQTSGVGTVRRVQVGRTTLIETVTTWEPGSTLSYAITGLPPVIRSVANTWRLESHGTGTLVTLTTEVDAGPRPPQQMIARVLGRKLAAASQEMLAGLSARINEQERAS